MKIVFPPVQEQLRAKKERQEKELRQSKETIVALKKLIEEKEELRRDYEKRLASVDQQHALELHVQHNKQRELQKELDQRAMTIAKLTDQLQREKEHQQGIAKRASFAPMILPDKPTKVKPHDESPRQQQQPKQSQRHSQPHRSLSNRSSSLNIRDSRESESIEVLLLRRRPPTPPQQLRSPSVTSAASNNDSLFTLRQRPLGNATSKSFVSPRLETKLPPIAIRKLPLKASAGSFIQQNTEL